MKNITEEPSRQARSLQAQINARALAKGTGIAYDYDGYMDGLLADNDKAHLIYDGNWIALPCIDKCGTVLHGYVEETERGEVLVIASETPGETVEDCYALCAVCADAPQLALVA